MKNKLLLFTILFCSFIAKAQVKIGDNSTTINANSLLELESTNKGVLLPRIALTNVATATPLAAHAKGMLIYNSSASVTGVSGNAEGIYQNDGSKWIQISSASNSWLLNGNAGTTAGTNFIGTTDNVDLVFKRNNQRAGLISLDNTSFGYNSLATSTGTWNTAFGHEALRNNTTGSQNTSIGRWSLSRNTTGTGNIAIGQSTMDNNLSGFGNIGLGNGAASQITSGANNIGFGNNALSNLTLGSNNISIGNNTSLPSNTGNNQLNIGNAIFGTGLSGSLVAPAGLIGIGTTAPTKTLDVFGNATVRSTFNALTLDADVKYAYIPDPANTFRYGLINNTNSLGMTINNSPALLLTNGDNYLRSLIANQTGLNFYTNGTTNANAVERMTILNNGNVGIGTTVPTQKLNIGGVSDGSMLKFWYTHIGDLVGGAGTMIGNNFKVGVANNKVEVSNAPASGAHAIMQEYQKGWSFISLPQAHNNPIGTAFDVDAITKVRITTAGNFGIGTITPAQKLHVEGSVQIVDGTEGVGKALVSDAAGKGTWTAINTNAVNTTATAAGTTTATVTGGNLEFLQNSAGMILLDSAGVKWKVTISTTGQLTIEKAL